MTTRLLVVGLSVTALLAAAAAAGFAQAQPPMPRFDGTWDLTWQTRSGPRQSGYFVFTRSGTALVGEIHGPSRSVRATGTASGSSFVLRGSRMLVPYRIEGRISGDRMEGSLKALSVERRFTGVRRP